MAGKESVNADDDHVVLDGGFESKIKSQQFAMSAILGFAALFFAIRNPLAETVLSTMAFWFAHLASEIVFKARLFNARRLDILEEQAAEQRAKVAKVAAFAAKQVDSAKKYMLINENKKKAALAANQPGGNA